MRWGGRVASMGERRGVYRVLAVKSEAKRPLRRPTHRYGSSGSGMGGGGAGSGLIWPGGETGGGYLYKQE